MQDIGLKIGIEIHQQLDTHKLFCNCPSELIDKEPEIEIKRRLYAVAGESGKIDAAAAYEQARKKTFIYQGYSNETCEIEFDDSPPRELNQEALDIALKVAILLNAEILPITQVMRKTVVDGSNTSGFQRTMLVARNGYIETSSKKKIRVDTVCLEEDSARRIGESENSVTFRLDRLGIPLIEIATAPDISSGEEAKEVALKIGEILRASKVRRGLGTIRQDVNVSIKNGERTEIKGVQEPTLIVKTVESEVKRQLGLVGKKQKVEKTVRQALETGETKFLRPMPGSARMYPETDLPLIKIANDMIESAKNNLPKLHSEMRDDLKKKGLSQEMTKLLLSERKLEEFKSLLPLSKDNPDLIVKILVLYPKEIASKEKIDKKLIAEKITIDVVEEVLEAIKENRVSESDTKAIMLKIINGAPVIEALKIEKIDTSGIEEEIKLIIKEKPGLSLGGYMGIVRQKFPQLPGKDAMDILKKLLPL
ncbi:MAG: Glu-tRNA(Gln) amidotransferase subunit GatE [Nanoarchaeota archaeon]|nr:Glu-tRNA(Gln) amidotransferase subunit GatE [Nanoarchaeota archaeon]